MQIRIPGRPVLDHRVQNHEQFAHAGHQSFLFGLSAIQEALVEVSDAPVVTRCREGGHVQGASHRGAPALGCALPLLLAAVGVEWSHPDELRNLLPVGLSQLWEFGQKHVGGRLPHAGN